MSCGENVLLKILYPTAGKNDPLKTQLSSFKKQQELLDFANRRYQTTGDIRFCDNIAQLLFSLKQKELDDNFQWIEFKSLKPVRLFKRDSLVLITESLGIPGTLLIILTMKLASGFESVSPGLVISKHLIDSLIFHYNKQCIKYLKYKLNMTNKIYLHPKGTFDCFNSVSLCHVLTFQQNQSLF